MTDSDCRSWFSAADLLSNDASAPVALLGAPLGAGSITPGRCDLAPETVRAMWRPEARRLGLAIWGLGALLYAPDGRGGFVVGHDGMNTPAIYTTARLDPAGGDGIITSTTAATLDAIWFYRADAAGATVAVAVDDVRLTIK